MADHIQHVVLLLLENQSFDRILGCFREVYADLDGVNPPGRPPYSNSDVQGNVYEQKPTGTKQVTPDPMHEVRFVLEQLQNDNGGFVLNYAREYPSSTQEERQEIMGYYPLDFLPALHGLAREFTICDRWFSSLPGPTWPNRFFALSGTCNGQVLMPEGWRHPQLAAYFNQTQDTIFDRLNEKGQSWRVYYYDFPSSLLLTHQRRPGNLIHYRPIGQFFKDCANPPHFPQFAFIEPKYFGADQNDDHPPHNIFKGDKLIADVYNALRSSPQLWWSTLLVIAFDEHGGFFDHVSPPAAVPPDNLPAEMDPDDHTKTFNFERLGPRVPAVLVSPWVGKGVEHTQFDHTSLLQYMTQKWGLGPLGGRTAAAASISAAFQTESRDDTPRFLRVPYTELIPPDAALEHDDLSAHQKALHAFAYFLARESGDEKTLQHLSQEPNVWVRTKAVMGNAMRSAGTSLASEARQMYSNRVKGMQELVEGLVRRAGRGG